MTTWFCKSFCSMIFIIIKNPWKEARQLYKCSCLTLRLLSKKSGAKMRCTDLRGRKNFDYKSRMTYWQINLSKTKQSFLQRMFWFSLKRLGTGLGSYQRKIISARKRKIWSSQKQSSWWQIRVPGVDPGANLYNPSLHHYHYRFREQESICLSHICVSGSSHSLLN